MIWTTETPTTPGWYWLRLPRANNGNGEATHGVIIVEVFDPGYADGSLFYLWGDEREDMRSLKDAEWAGPLPLPADEPITEAWLNGWYRVGASVFIGTGVHCAGCGKFNGIGCVAIDPNAKWPETMPDWPFNEASCPLCTWRENPPSPRDPLTERLERLAKTRKEAK